MRSSTPTLILLLGCFLAAASWAQPVHTVFVYRGALPLEIAPFGGLDDHWFKEIEVVDVDNDGWLDIYGTTKQAGTSNPGPNKDVLFINNEDIVLALDSAGSAFTLKPTFQAFPHSFDSWRGYDAEFADLDGDQNIDLIRPDRGSLLVLWGNGQGVFGATAGDVTDILAIGNPNQGCFASGNYDDIDVVDFDGDADLDFAVAEYDLSPCRNFIVENLGNRTFAVRAVSPPDGDELPAEGTHSVSAGDVNGDGAIDIVLANSLRVSNEPPSVYLGIVGSPYTFGNAPILLAQPGLTTVDTTVADLVDLNQDGFLDVYVAQAGDSDQAPGGIVQGVYFHSTNNNAPYPTFTAGPLFDAPDDPPGTSFFGIYDARYADLDVDGDLEIVAVNINVRDGFETFETRLQVSTVSNSQIADRSGEFVPSPDSALRGSIAVDLGDLDQDGDEDMVLGGIRDGVGAIEHVASAHIYENRTFTVLEDVALTSGTFVAIKRLTAQAGVQVPAGGNVTFEAGETVVLAAGFEALSGSEFRATIFDTTGKDVARGQGKFPLPTGFISEPRY